jgi:hypothetical protein
MASTPPVQPSRIVNVSDNSASQNASLTLLITGNGYVSYTKPPEYILVEASDMTDGSKRGTFSVSRRNDVCEAENTCTYSASVSTGIFPSGKYMLVAHDPLSGAPSRQTVTINTNDKGNKDFFKRFEQEQRFFLVSGILAAFLVIALAILAGERKFG